MLHNLTANYAAELATERFGHWDGRAAYASYFILLILLRRNLAVVGVVIAVTVSWRLLRPVSGEATVGSPLLRLGTWGHWPFSYWLHLTLGALAVNAFFENRELPAWTKSGKLELVLVLSGFFASQTTYELITGTSLATTARLDLLQSIMPSIHFPGELVVATGFFCLMQWCIDHENSRNLNGRLATILSYIGKASYSICLAHVPVFYVLTE